jgi:hypothetical protein
VRQFLILGELGLFPAAQMFANAQKQTSFGVPAALSVTSMPEPATMTYDIDADLKTTSYNNFDNDLLVLTMLTAKETAELRLPATTTTATALSHRQNPRICHPKISS